MSHDRPKLAFYRRLTRSQQREYDRSDSLGKIPIKPVPVLGRVATTLVVALERGEVRAIRTAAQALADEICRRVRRKGSPPPLAPRIRVLKTRPRLADGEYHGLYTLYEDGRCEIRVWMLTAANRQLVRPRTFVRTLLHELIHHMDMVVLDLPSSFHTIGFHARESSLLRVLEASGAVIPGARKKSSAPAVKVATKVMNPPGKLLPRPGQPVPVVRKPRSSGVVPRTGQLDLF